MAYQAIGRAVVSKLWNWLCCVGYGVQARRDGLWHLVRGHRLRWRADVDLWSGHTGCIICEACPDTSDGRGDLALWCRWNTLIWAVTRRVCAWRGHGKLRHPQRSIGWNEAAGEGIYEDITSDWYCCRCMDDVEAPK